MKENPAYTLRGVARRIGFQASYLSKIERGDTPPPSEERIVALAQVLAVDADELLAMAGKVSKDVREIIMANPLQFARLIRQMRDLGHKEMLYVTEAATRYGKGPDASQKRGEQG